MVIACVRYIHGPQFKAILITGETSSALRHLDEDSGLKFLSKPADLEVACGLLRMCGGKCAG